MATTYLELTNRVLRRLNEVELTQGNFNSSRGVHSAVKDAVQDTVRKINHSRYKWPWLFATGTQVLTVGQEEYSWPASFQAVEWSSFYVEKDGTIGNNTALIQPLPREKYYLRYRNNDLDSGTSGKDIPFYVFQTPTGWGITSSPNEAYTVKFRYWTVPTDMSAYDDECLIPTEHDYVVTLGALYHLYLFLDNPDRTQLAAKAFTDGMDDLINRYSGENHQYAHSTRGMTMPKIPNR